MITALTITGVAWLATATGVAVLLASAAPLSERRRRVRRAATASRRHRP